MAARSPVTRRRSVLARSALALSLLLVAAACGDDDGGGGEPSAAAGGEVVVGVIVPTTGPQTQIGAAVLDAIEHYVETNPEAGGHRIRLVVEDGASNPQQALAKARKLVENDRVDAVVGIVNSAVLEAVKDYITGQDVPLLVTTAASDSLTTPPVSPFAFRPGNSAGQNNRVLGWYAAEKLGHERVAILTYDFVAGSEFAGAFKATFEDAGGSIADEQRVPLNTADFGPFFSKVPSDIDALYVFVGGADAVRFWQQAKEFGLAGRVPIIGPQPTLDPLVLAALGDAPVGFIGAIHYLASLDIAGNAEFVDAYTKAVGHPPTFYEADAYTTMQVLAAAVEEIDGEVDRAAIAEKLPDVEFDAAPRGEFAFDENHQAVYDVHIYEGVAGGAGVELRVVETIEGVTQDWEPPEGAVE